MRAACLAAWATGGIADPGAVVVGAAAGVDAVLVAGAVSGEDLAELVPVDGAGDPMVVFVAECRVGDGEAEVVGLGDGGVDEFLAQFVVGEALDAPAHGGVGVLGLGVRRAEHHQAGPPPAVHRVLRHGFCSAVPRSRVSSDLETLALMEGLFLADADHGAGVGAVGAAAQRDLVHDRRAVDQPADHADVGPRGRRVVEDAEYLALAGRRASISWSRETSSVSAALYR